MKCPATENLVSTLKGLNFCCLVRVSCAEHFLSRYSSVASEIHPPRGCGFVGFVHALHMWLFVLHPFGVTQGYLLCNYEI